MITETLFVGRNNTFSLKLIRGESFVPLISILTYSLTLTSPTGTVLTFTDLSLFTEKDDGIVEINIAPLLTTADIGTHKAILITFDTVNTLGVRWPKFKIKVK